MQRLRTVLALVALGAATALPTARAQTIQTATAAAEKDLQTAVTQLADTRNEIAQEKIPLLRDVSRLETEVAEKARELSNLQRLRDNRDLDLNRLREQVKAIAGQNDYVSSLLDEFVRSFETRVHFAETQLYASPAEEARLALGDANLSTSEQFAKQLELVGVALERLDRLTGGYTFEGKALAPDGTIEPGKFAVVGPAVYFRSDASDLTGIAHNKLNAAEAAVAPTGPAFAAGIRQLIDTNEGSLPADPTLGKALKIQESTDTIGEHLAKGGSVGYVIIGLGIISGLLGLYKLVKITAFKTPRPEQVRTVLTQIEDGELDAAKNTAATVPGVGGELLVTGVRHAGEKRGILEEILSERLLHVRPELEKFLPFLAITAAAAPLLGLLGTVTGMIKTFNLITVFGTGDAKSLSSGISEALVTTELGLVVAIPALILHGLLLRMARQKLGRLEQTAVGFINGVMSGRTRATETV